MTEIPLRPLLRSAPIRLLVLLPGVLLLSAWLLSACAPGPQEPGPTPSDERNPWLVVGIDGAEWRVIETLWSAGDLPHLKALAEAGTRARLETAYSTSPIIWTTLGTGRMPEDHGITGFTVQTDRGEIPVSASVRKVPALWNMADRAGLRTAVLGWWATWPAEDIDGIMLSDRIFMGVERPFSPESLAPRIEAWTAELEQMPADGGFGGNPASSRRDWMMSRAAVETADEGYDLTLLYYRSVDIECHNSWKYFEPKAFGVRPAEHLAHRERIPDAYRAVDRAVGRALEQMPPNTNVVVISDHGFHAKPREELLILLDMNRVLERLGWVTLKPDGKPDLSKSRVYSYGTAKNRREKRIRFSLRGRDEGGRVAPEDRDAVRAELTADLARLTYEDGSAVFLVRDAEPQAASEGTDFEAVVLSKGASLRTLLDGKPVDGLVEHVNRVSGTHSPDTHGILIAAGPDVEPGADVSGITIFDFAPTLLYGLGLPVGDDFAGKPFQHLFTPTFRDTHPLRRVSSWGTMEGWKKPQSSPVDQELLDELQSLGYI